MKLAVSKKFLLWFSLAVVVLAANIFISKNALVRQFDATDAVAKSLHVIDAIKDVQFNTANLEIAQRNYIVSGNGEYLKRAHDTLRAARDAVAKVCTLTEGNTEVSKDAEELESLIEERLLRSTEVLEVHETMGFSAAIKAITSAGSGAAMDRIYRVVGRMGEAEDRLLDQRTEQSRQNTNLSLFTFYVAAMFNLILLCLIYFLAYREIRERRQAERKLLFTATHDPLTALPNRTLFSERLDRRLGLQRRQNDRLAVLFIDLDRFKKINDTLGHEAGDRLLQDVAHRLSGCIRQSDTVARQGGDEFVVLIEEYSDPRDIAIVAEKILAEVAKPLLLDGREFHITASIGISTYPQDGADIPTLLKNADIAMYRAKDKGKNNYQFYARQTNTHTVERLAMEADLRRALERDELILHYQPKVDAHSGRLTSVEALLRWRHPTLGMISPTQCIPLAEETGLIVPIGEWVLSTACARNRAWQHQGLPRLRIAVNLSPRQFGDSGLAAKIRKILTDTGLEAQWLELEITESMVMHDPEQSVRTMEQLKAMGIQLAIDDFGIGYSSLAYLKRFPIDSLKMDGSFIRDIPHNSEDAAITQAIIAMGHSLKLRVIAEGVETELQAAYLREQHCDEMQGFYFSKALPENDFVTLLKEPAKQPSTLYVLPGKKLFPS